jgi:hypothetical protein
MVCRIWHHKVFQQEALALSVAARGSLWLLLLTLLLRRPNHQQEPQKTLPKATQKAFSHNMMSLKGLCDFVNTSPFVCHLVIRGVLPPIAGFASQTLQIFSRRKLEVHSLPSDPAPTREFVHFGAPGGGAREDGFRRICNWSLCEARAPSPLNP